MDARKTRLQAFASVLLTLGLLGVGYASYQAAPKSGNGTYTYVAQTMSAVDVARQIDCGRVQDLGSVPLGGVVDHAICYKDGEKYAIDTFTTEEVRNAWLNMTETHGVVPKWEASTWVAYPSIDNVKTTL